MRPQLPGVPFHVTARLQGRAAWFAGVERPVISRILDAPRRSDAALVAYALMPNHLHLVVVQGRQPLSELMQPMLRRIALLLQRRTNIEGHIFERRFRASACPDPDYLRNAIAYVHLNGVRAELCSTADEYEWCSHAAFCALPDRTEIRAHDVPMENALRVFAARQHDTLHECRANYRAFLKWRCVMDEHVRREREGLHTEPPPGAPPTLGGDLHWRMNYWSAATRREPLPENLRPDLLDVARVTLDEIDPDMCLETLRSGYRTKALVAVRRRFILRAIAAGHRGGVIARFLRIAPTTVSSVRTAAMYEGR